MDYQMSIYAWENIKEVTYRSELIDGVENNR